VKPSYCEYMATKYGTNSNIFRIRVAGEPPAEDDNVLIPLAWSMQCVGNEISIPEDEPRYLSADVARYGDDASIILPRRGNWIEPWETFHSLNTITLAGFILRSYTELEAQGIGVDEIGVGAGVVDWLEKRNLRNLYGVNVTHASSNTARFHRLRDELWVTMREKCLEARYYFPDVTLPGDSESLGAQLANELSSPRYSFNNEGGYVVEHKKDMRARGIASPNIADALGISEYFYNVSTQVFRKKTKVQENTYDRSRMAAPSYYGENKRAWQAN
jgi:phage terminase large subunit